MDENKRDDLGPAEPDTESRSDPPPAPEPLHVALTLDADPVTGEMLKTLREQLGLTQKEFAEFVHLPPGTVATWERRGTLSAPAAYLVRSVDKKTAKARQATVEAQRALRKVITSGL